MQANNFKALKYSYALILRQSKEIEGIVTTPLVEHFIEFQPNGFVELFIKAMGIKRNNDSQENIKLGMVYSEPIFFSDLCKWAEKNKLLIKDNGYINKFKRKLEGVKK